MTHVTHDACSPGKIRAGRPGAATWLARLRDALVVYRQRRRLAQLDSARLRDIGLSFDEARREAQRPIWDVPHTWRTPGK